MTERIAVSTGKIDKRTVNGNNNTRRGKDKGKRKRHKKKLVLRDEVHAGIRFRLSQAIRYHGGVKPTARFLGVTHGCIEQCVKSGYASPNVANLFQDQYRKKRTPFRASYLRPDLGMHGRERYVTKGDLKMRFYRVEG